eukprot:97308_1
MINTSFAFMFIVIMIILSLTSGVNLTQIDVDVLEHVMSFLSLPEQQKHFRKINNRFNKIYKEILDPIIDDVKKLFNDASFEQETENIYNKLKFHSLFHLKLPRILQKWFRNKSGDDFAIQVDRSNCLFHWYELVNYYTMETLPHELDSLTQLVLYLSNSVKASMLCINANAFNYSAIEWSLMVAIYDVTIILYECTFNHLQLNTTYLNYLIDKFGFIPWTNLQTNQYIKKHNLSVIVDKHLDILDGIFNGIFANESFSEEFIITIYIESMKRLLPNCTNDLQNDSVRYQYLKWLCNVSFSTYTK